MSSSESAPATSLPSQKRPLEDPSSDSGPSDQPDAKRPALDGGLGQDGAPAPSAPNANTKSSISNGESGSQDASAPATANGAAAPDAATASSASINGFRPADEVLHTQPIQSTASLNSNGGSSSAAAMPDQDESEWLHIRAIISSGEAATIIGKGGENVNMIRRSAGAKCNISEYTRGAVERILTVSGLVDAVSKAFGLIIRTLNQEPLDAKSTADSKTYPLRLLIPHVLIGSVIGHKGLRIREIQEASSAKVSASSSCLPFSSERSLIVLGVADAVHIATYYIGTTLVNQLTDKYGGPAASAYVGRNGAASGIVTGGLVVVPYAPVNAGGQWGHPSGYTPRISGAGRGAAGAPYGGQQQQQQPQPQGFAPNPAPVQQSMQYGAGASRGYTGAGPAAPPAAAQYPQQGMGQPPQGQAVGPGGFAGQPLTQQIYIPNDMVGAIIGKGGQKINEIRGVSGSVIKINEPTDNSNERLVTVTGTQECNQMALYMLYQRLGESEIHCACKKDSNPGAGY